MAGHLRVNLADRIFEIERESQICDEKSDGELFEAEASAEDFASKFNDGIDKED